ncbi:MAG TPA: Zn-dependent hydrolase [Candidatus Avanaerovorax faecigallinarum]|nr:Zn-dependent hydrolase [Candidatus Avanaerovorax faecigallinarum]
MIDAEMQWIESAIEKVAETGKKEDGTYWRATYTDEDKKGVELLKRWMKDAGFYTYFDTVGNLYGRIEGRTKDVILAGSHRDTVKNGGKYDGVLGIITAISACASLYREYGIPKKTVEVVALCEEEASRFLAGYVGSRAITGTLRNENLQELDENGVSLEEAMRCAGYYEGVLPKERGNVKQFLELHIEQGGFLESAGKQVGIVTAIVGIFAGDIYFYGEQNHAGTTPMSMRKDPVPVAASFVTALNKWAMTKGDKLVCTIGNVVIEPGKSNVIANKVKITFDIRSESQELLTEAKNKIESLLKEFPEYMPETDFACQDSPVAMDAGGIERLKQLAEKENQKVALMPSGAGHDSQIIAQKIKTNMIFVPSERGISHSPLEYTDIMDIRPGYTLMKSYLKEKGWGK